MENYIILIGSLKKGGAERNAVNLANNLVEKGHKVTIVLFIKEIAFTLNSLVEIRRIEHKRFRFNFLNAIYVIYQLRKILRELKPKRLIAMASLGSIFAISTLYKNTIVRFDTYPLYLKERKRKRIKFFYNLPWVKYIVCPSEEMRKDVFSFLPANQRKLVTVYNPIIKSSDYVNPEQINSITRPYLIIVSRLNKDKNIAQVIETMFKYNLFKQVDLMILGSGPEEENLKKLVENLNLTNNIHFKGFVNDPKPYMAKALALISASEREGFPNVLIESLSLGTPVVSSSAKTGPKEIVYNGVNGFLFEVHNYEKLGECIQLVLDKELYKLLKINSGHGLERFSQTEVMKSWYKIL